MASRLGVNECAGSPWRSVQGRGAHPSLLWYMVRLHKCRQVKGPRPPIMATKHGPGPEEGRHVQAKLINS